MRGRSADDCRTGGSEGPSDRESFAAWIGQSPRNIGAFLRGTALDLELQGLDAGRTFDLEAVIARAREELASGTFEVRPGGKKA
jgi:hypothetical protein